jgi:hypothetical protein
MNIYQKLAAITADLGVVAKNLNVETGKGKGYKAVSERDVIDAVKPLEAKYGVYSYPAERKVLESNLLESESTYQGNVTKKTTLMTRIQTVYRFVNIDDPSEYIETTVFAEGLDSQDKGSGKAMTYADKYALMKAYKISTGDDPDQSASEEVQYMPQQYSAPVVSGRDELIDELRRRGIDFKAFAADHGLTKTTSDMVFHKVLADLRAGVM